MDQVEAEDPTFHQVALEDEVETEERTSDLLDAFPWLLPKLTLRNCTSRIFLWSWLCKQALQGQGQIKKKKKCLLAFERSIRIN